MEIPNLFSIKQLLHYVGKMAQYKTVYFHQIFTQQLNNKLGLFKF